MAVIPPAGVQVGVVAHAGRRGMIDAGLVGALEDLGVDSLWAPGHLAIGRDVPEAMMGLARLAALSHRAVVGTAVLLLPLYHPVIVAKQLAELDAATGGRVALGVGVGGEYQQEFSACQVRLDERGPRTDEAIGVIRRLWTEDEVDHEGRFWSFVGVGIAPRPANGAAPPVIVAGRKAPAMRRAAAVGDGWMPFLYSAERYATSVASVRQHAADIGRDLSGFQWMAFLYVSLDDDPAAARERALSFIGAGQAGDPSRFEALIDRVAVTGTAEQVRSGLQAFVDAGARHLIVIPCELDDQLPAVHRLMTDVVPNLEVPGAAR